MKLALLAALLSIAIPSAAADQECVGGGSEPNPSALANVCTEGQYYPVPVPAVTGPGPGATCLVGETCVTVEENHNILFAPVVTYVSVACVVIVGGTGSCL